MTKRKSAFGLGFALMAGLLTGGATVSQGATLPTNQTASKKDAIKEEVKPVNPEAQRRKNGFFSSENVYKHNRRGFLNQEQKRKKLRQNPLFARSKKCTTKR
jgi:hypothetical protein